ncbi:phage regulatory CII family protein [Enterobacter sp.]|uniref:phage regulatory CII family protein n=1 Tax=Enterobacter sp. TaxID=42895 RepID=UPI00296F1ABA|nr:phage regulatory CII family protein [Enterobacter sp.]
MLDFRVSSHAHFDEACRKFSATHSVKELAEKAGIKPHTLYNKLNPEQPHQLTPREIWVLTDLTEDSTLVDGFLAQIHCLPCVPVNELAPEKMQTYIMRAMGELGVLATGAISAERLTPARKRGMIECVNSGIRMLTLTAIAMQARVQGNPAMASVVDSVSGIGASFGVM